MRRRSKSLDGAAAHAEATACVRLHGAPAAAMRSSAQRIAGAWVCAACFAEGNHNSSQLCGPGAGMLGLRFFSQPTSLTVKQTRPSGWVGMGFGVYLAAQVGGWVWGLGFSVLNYQRRGKSRPCARVAQRRPCVSQRATKPPLVVPLNKGM